MKTQQSKQAVFSDSGACIGYTYKTLGGFYRGYAYTGCIGNGPFATREQAAQWIRTARERFDSYKLEPYKPQTV